MTKPLKPPTVAYELAVQCLEDGERWFGDQGVAHSLVHHTLGLTGEAGEFANMVKKIDRGSLDPNDAKTRYELVMELADVFTYLLNLAGILRVDLIHAYNAKRVENQKRFTQQRTEREAKNNG